MSHTIRVVCAPVFALALVSMCVFGCAGVRNDSDAECAQPCDGGTEPPAKVAQKGGDTGDDCKTSVWCPSRPDTRNACYSDAGIIIPDCWETTVNNFGAKGLYTSPSTLVAAPPGAAIEANEVVVDVPGEYTTRHGFQRLPSALPDGVPVRSWTTYQGAIIAHSGATLYRYASGVWTAYPGIYFPAEEGEDDNGDALQGRVKFFEIQQTLYFTTAAGVYRLESVAGVPQPAGVAQAVPGTVAVYRAGQALSAGSNTAYRYVWGRRGANGRIMLGTTSGRVVISNRNEAFDFNPISVVKSGGVVTVTVGPGIVGRLLVGQSLALSGVDASDVGNFPEGAKIVDSIGASSFTYAQSGANATALDPGAFAFISAETSVSIQNTAPIPDGVDGSYFFQAYRSDEVPLGVDPSDEMYLVNEKAFAEMPVGATSYTFVDDTPDALKGDSLYTNQNSGGGISASHYPPPKATVVATFQNRAVYANVELPERISLSLISVDAASGGLRIGQGLKFTNAMGGIEQYTGDVSASFPNRFKIFSNGSPSQNVKNTALSLVAAINSRVGGFLRATYTENGDFAGSILVESRKVSEGAIIVEGIGNTGAFLPAISATFQADFIVRVSATSTVTVSSMTPISLVVGQKIKMLSIDPSGAGEFTLGEKTVIGVSPPYVFRYSEAGPDAAVIMPNAGEFSTIAPEVSTDDEAAPGGWMVSDEFNPDSVPALIPEIAGDRYKRVLSALVLGNSLFLLKEDGLFRITGNDPTNYIVDRVDSTVKFVAPRTAFTIGTRAYALTSQGLMSWTESTRPEPASVPIESDLRAIIAAVPYAVEEFAFALNHDSRRRAYLWMPNINGDSTGAHVYVYSTLTDAWTLWDKKAVDAMVNPVDDLLYIAPPENEGTGIAPAPAKERYTGTVSDYQDEDGQVIWAQVTWTPLYATDNTQNQLVRAQYKFADNLPLAVDVAFSTNYTPTRQWFTLSAADPQFPGTMGTPPTQEHSRGNSHTLSIRHAQHGYPLRLLGYSARVRTYTTN